MLRHLEGSGRLGALLVEFPDAASAARHAEKLIDEKIGKGYVAVS